MIIMISLFLILAILIISGVIISKVIKIYLYSSKNKEMWKKEIKEEKDYQFIKGLY